MAMMTDLVLKMNGAPYYTPVFARQTLRGVFEVIVTNFIGGATVITIVLQHRNDDDTTWTSAGTFAPIGGDGPASIDQAGLKQWLRLKITVAANNSYEGATIFVAAPTWLVD